MGRYLKRGKLGKNDTTTTTTTTKHGNKNNKNGGVNNPNNNENEKGTNKIAVVTAVWILVIGTIIIQTNIGSQLPEYLVFDTKRTAILGNDGDERFDGNVSYIYVRDAEREEDTSIIITSSLIPTHPEIKMINDTITSFSCLQGLSPTVPIFIALDGLRPEELANASHVERYDGYIKNLRAEYRNRTNIHIIPAYKNGHINHNIKQALDMVDSEFIYLVQHDFAFLGQINHTGLIKTMREYPLNARLILFNKRRNPAKADCIENNTLYNVNGIQLLKTKRWSDNNHLTTRQYYVDLLKRIGPTPRPPESPMINSAWANCSWYGPYLYGGPGEEAHIVHLDGRLTLEY